MNNDWVEDYLMHHGVLGQKWGVRRYQNYDGSLKSTGKSRRQQISTLNNLSKTMNSFEYGTIINGRRYNEEDLDKVDWSQYRTIPLKTVAKERIGNCWDFVHYQHAELKKAGIPDKTFIFLMNRGDGPDDIVSHTFTMAQIDGQNKWLESAFWKFNGVHDVKDVDDIVKKLADSYDPSGKLAFDVYEYDPEGMDQGLTGDEYVTRATAKDPVLQRKKG